MTKRVENRPSGEAWRCGAALEARSQDPLADGIERYVALEHLEPDDLRIRGWGMSLTARDLHQRVSTRLGAVRQAPRLPAQGGRGGFLWHVFR